MHTRPLVKVTLSYLLVVLVVNGCLRATNFKKPLLKSHRNYICLSGSWKNNDWLQTILDSATCK